MLDHHSRALVATKVFLSQPSARDVTRLLDAARRRSGATPKYIVSDQGAQFQVEYRAWCGRRGVRPRFGAVGQSGSIAIIERFFRSLKEEMLRRLPLLPMTRTGMAREVDAYAVWYHEHRPHQGLAGRPRPRCVMARRPRPRSAAGRHVHVIRSLAAIRLDPPA